MLSPATWAGLFVTDMTDGENISGPGARTGGLTGAGRAAVNHQNDLQRRSVRSINRLFIRLFARASSAVEALRSRLSNTRRRSNDGPVAQATAGRAVYRVSFASSFFSPFADVFVHDGFICGINERRLACRFFSGRRTPHSN